MESDLTLTIHVISASINVNHVDPSNALTLNRQLGMDPIVNNTERANDPRARLTEKLIYLNGLLRWIDERWQAKAAVAQKYAPLEQPKHKWGLRMFALLTAGITVVSAVIGAPIIQVWARDQAKASGSIRLPNVDPLAVAILSLPVALILAAGILLFFNRVLLPRKHASTQAVNEQREVHNRAVWAEEQQVNAQLNKAGQDFAQHVGTQFFPQAYLHQEAVAYCADMVHNHRANTVSEAINHYETDMWRRRMEQGQAAMIAEQQRTQKLVAIGTVVNAAMTGAAIGTMRAEGAKTRSAIASAAATRPTRVTVEVRKKSWSVW